MGDKEIFLGDFTQKGFYDALHFMRVHGGHKRNEQRKKKGVKKETNDKEIETMKKMCVVVEYDEEVLVQKDVIDLLLESSGGRYRIKSHILLSPSQDPHKDALFRLDSFCNWVMKECTTRHDSPFYIGEYLHEKVDEWYKGNNRSKGGFTGIERNRL